NAKGGYILNVLKHSLLLYTNENSDDCGWLAVCTSVHATNLSGEEKSVEIVYNIGYLPCSSMPTRPRVCTSVLPGIADTILGKLSRVPAMLVQIRVQGPVAIIDLFKISDLPSTQPKLRNQAKWRRRPPLDKFRIHNNLCRPFDLVQLI